MAAGERTPIDVIQNHRQVYLETSGNIFESPAYISSWKEVRSLGLSPWRIEQLVEEKRQEHLTQLTKK